MLGKMRDGVKSGVLKYFLLGALFLAAAGLILTDFGGFLRGQVSDTDVARIGGAKIHVQDFDRNVQRFTNANFMSPRNAYRIGLVDQLLQKEISTSLIAMEAQRLGFQLSEEDTARVIAQMSDVVAQNDETRAEALDRFLRVTGVSKQEYITTVRQDTVNGILNHALETGTGVHPFEVKKTLYRYENEKRSLQIVTLRNEDIKIDADADDSDLKAYYESNQGDYIVPETRAVSLILLTQEALEKTLQVTEKDIEERYQDEIDNFQIAEQRVIRQSVVADEQTANKIAEKAKTGGLQQATKDVTGSDDSYFSDEEYDRNALLDTGDAVFNAKKDAFIGPIQTPLGWHVIQVVEIYPAENIPLRDVADDIRADILAERVHDEMMDMTDLLDDRLASGDALTDIQKDTPIEIINLGQMRENGFDEKGQDRLQKYAADRRLLLDNIFGNYEEGEISPVFDLVDGDIAALRIDAVTPQSVKDFTEVRDQVETGWAAQRRKMAASEKAAALKAESEKSSLKKAAAAMGLPVKEREVGRVFESGGTFSQQDLNKIFQIGKNEILMLENEDGYSVIAIDKITLPDTINTRSDDFMELSDRVRNAMKDEIVNQYVNTLAKDKNVKINKDLLDSIYGGGDQE